MKGKCIVCDADQILINGNQLESCNEAANALIESAKVQDKEDLIDFSETNFTPGIQDYLVSYLYNKDFEINQEQLEALQYYKTGGFKAINGFMRGKFDIINDGNIPINDLIKKILLIDKIAENAPSRKYDIILSRLGNGKHNDNKYDSFVSFGTNSGTYLGNYDTGVRYSYKRILKKDDPAIPVEKLCPYALLDYYSECEIITLPFKYSLVEKQENKNGIIHKTSIMENTEQLNVKDILLSRLQELKTQNNNSKDIENAIKLVEEDNIEQNSLKEEQLISQVVEGKNMPRLSLINKIVKSIRNKIMQKEKENQNQKTGEENATNR